MIKTGIVFAGTVRSTIQLSGICIEGTGILAIVEIARDTIGFNVKKAGVRELKNF